MDLFSSFSDIFLEIQFTCHTVHPFKVYNSVAFHRVVYSQSCPSTSTVSFRTFSLPSKKDKHPIPGCQCAVLPSPLALSNYTSIYVTVLDLPVLALMRASLLSHVRLFVIVWIVAYQVLCLWDSPGKDTGVGCHGLFQRIFLAQGSNPCLLCLLHWKADSLPTEPSWEGTIGYKWNHAVYTPL